MIPLVVALSLYGLGVFVLTVMTLMIGMKNVKVIPAILSTVFWPFTLIYFWVKDR